ncbi:MAG: glucose PTS transporter subunit IIA, partial [Firmicutes bacterium]|nr:glucose PTS transporter subunit IIA [Bacillota bacterium]
QVVIGNTVPEVYKEVVALLGNAFVPADKAKEKFSVVRFLKSLPNRFISTVAGIFPRVIMLIAAAGLLLGLRQILLITHAMPENSGTDIVFATIGFAALTFLPVLLGFSAGKHFGGNPYLTALVGATLMHPNFAALAGGSVKFLGVSINMIDYAGSVIPILFSSYVCVKLEKFLMAKLPTVIKNFVAPMLCLLVVVPITLLLIGPLFTWVGDTLAKGYESVPNWVGGILVGAIWQVLVIFGIHHAFSFIDLNNLKTLGSSSFGTFTQIAAFGQTGAAFGLLLKMKDKKTRGVTLSSVVTGIFGITEPIIYGVTLPRKKPFVMGVIGGAVGGGIAGALGSKIYNSGAWGLLGLPSGISPSGVTLGFFGWIIGLVVSFVVAALLCFFVYKDDTQKACTQNQATPPSKDTRATEDASKQCAEEQTKEMQVLTTQAIDKQVLDATQTQQEIVGLQEEQTKQETTVSTVTVADKQVLDATQTQQEIVGLQEEQTKQETTVSTVQATDQQVLETPQTQQEGVGLQCESTDLHKIVVLQSPLKGRVLPLSEAQDTVFAMGAMGQGVVIEPVEGKVYAPFDCEVVTVFHTKHMIGLADKKGVEVIIHLGVDTVQLGGEHFFPKVQAGDVVASGQLLMEFELESIKVKGYSMQTPIIVTQTPNVKSVKIQGAHTIEMGEKLLQIEIE